MSDANAVADANSIADAAAVIHAGPERLADAIPNPERQRIPVVERIAGGDGIAIRNHIAVSQGDANAEAIGDSIAHSGTDAGSYAPAPLMQK